MHVYVIQYVKCYFTFSILLFLLTSRFPVTVPGPRCSPEWEPLSLLALSPCHQSYLNILELKSGREKYPKINAMYGSIEKFNKYPANEGITYSGSFFSLCFLFLFLFLTYKKTHLKPLLLPLVCLETYMTVGPNVV